MIAIRALCVVFITMVLDRVRIELDTVSVHANYWLPKCLTPAVSAAFAIVSAAENVIIGSSLRVEMIGNSEIRMAKSFIDLRQSHTTISL